MHVNELAPGPTALEFGIGGKKTPFTFVTDLANGLICGAEFEDGSKYAIFPSGVGFPLLDLELMRTRCSGNSDLAQALALDGLARPLMVFKNEVCLDLTWENRVDFGVADNRRRVPHYIYVAKSEYGVFLLRCRLRSSPDLDLHAHPLHPLGPLPG